MLEWSWRFKVGGLNNARYYLQMGSCNCPLAYTEDHFLEVFPRNLCWFAFKLLAFHCRIILQPSLCSSLWPPSQTSLCLCLVFSMVYMNIAWAIEFDPSLVLVNSVLIYVVWFFHSSSFYNCTIHIVVCRLDFCFCLHTVTVLYPCLCRFQKGFYF